MNNKGKVTVFLCLIVTVILFLGISVIKALEVYKCRQKTVMCTRIAIENVKAKYNPYIFEHYHILLFDTDRGGDGQAAFEEDIRKDIQNNLGSDFTILTLAMTDFRRLTDDGCQAFKEQISEYTPYAVAEDVGEYILDSTKDEEVYVPTEITQDMTEEDGELTGENTIGDEGEENAQSSDIDDPRSVSSAIGENGVLSYVMPEGLELNTIPFDVFSLPSYSHSSIFPSIDSCNYRFDDIFRLEDDLKSQEGWVEKLGEKTQGVIYANTVFNCATNREINTNTAITCEREYLICGSINEKSNLENVVNKIIAIRLPINFTYLVSSPTKQSLIMSKSTIIAAMVPIPEKVIRYLTAGAWAYVESVAEVRNLLQGKSLALGKNDSNWLTDINNLSSTMFGEYKDVENGLDYEDYLTILLAMEGDDIYLRMLDLIQINTISNYGDVLIDNCGVELWLDVGISYLDEENCFNISGGY
ncbi:MAG: hypothetical protein IJX12_04110 [Lachnospiraceae bacterium]|nr:hypothetical protein [Lachnospiraceae bacterium]